MVMPSGMPKNPSKLDILIQGATTFKASKAAASWITALVKAVLELRRENLRLKRELREAWASIRSS